MIGKLLKLEWNKFLCVGRLILLLYAIMIFGVGMVGRNSVAMQNLGYVIFIYLWVYGPSGYSGDQLMGILPVQRRQVVLARYLFCAAGAAAGALVMGLMEFPFHKSVALTPIITLFCLGCLFAAITLPFLLYFGPQKARYYVLAVYVVSVVLATLFGTFSGKMELRALPVPAFSLFCISVGLLLISLLVSLRLYQRREF